MIGKIKELEILSSVLTPSKGERQELMNKIISYTEKFIDDIPNDPAYYFSGNEITGLNPDFIFDEEINIDFLLKEFSNKIVKSGINGASGAHLGYIPGSTLFHSALGDFIAAVTNRYAGVYFASPGAVKLENNAVKWMSSLIGYNENAKGILTSGGSVANLTAIVAAREAAGLRANDYTKSVVYLTAQTHHSVEKALRIAGMGECIKHYIGMDKNFKMISGELEKAVTKDKKTGLIPWLIIAAAGTTDTGAVDPLNEISEIAEKNRVWNHVDGAYGAFFILTERGKKLFDGIEKSDSIVMDPHKGLFIPFGTGAVIVQNGKQLFDAYSYQAGYMQDTIDKNIPLSPADISPELSKHFRGLRLWLPLKLLGISPFRAALEEKLLLAQYAYCELKKIHGIKLGPEPELSILTFRYVPKYGDANSFNKTLLEEIHKDGRIFISSTMLNGEFTLRLAVLSYRTHLQEIDMFISIIKEKIKQLSSI